MRASPRAVADSPAAATTPSPRTRGDAGPAAGRQLSGDSIAGTLVLAITLVGFAVRVWTLGAKSLWLDEGLSVLFAGRSLRDLVATLVREDLHPPLHYVILHTWMALGGASEFAVRLPSAVAGTLAIPATYALGWHLLRPGDGAPDPGAATRARLTGVLAAALVALAPFLVYYSQEARMYAQLVGLAAVASVGFWRLLEGPPGRRRFWGAVYVGSLVGLLYTQYFGAFVPIAHLAYAALTLRHYRRALLPVALCWALAVAAFMPWLYPAWLQMTRLRGTPDFWRGALSLRFIVEHTFAAFAVGTSWNLGPYLPVLVVVGALLALGAGWGAWRGALSGRRPTLFLLMNLLVPVIVLAALTRSNPKFTERYLIVAAPAFYLLVARSLAAIGTIGELVPIRAPALARAPAIAAGLVAAGLLIASAREVGRVYTADAYAKDDNRAAIAHIEREAHPGDAVLLILNAYHTWYYYFRGEEGDDGLLRRGGIDRATDFAFAADTLNALVPGRSRLWVLLWNPDWADPSGWVRDALDATLERRGTEHFRGLELRLYQLPPNPRFSASPEPGQRVERDFGGRLALIGYDVDAGGRVLAPGELVPLALYWRATRPVDEDLWVALRLRRDGFEWWARQQRPTAYTYPTFDWRVGQVVRGYAPLSLPVGLPPGEYELTVAVYDPARGRDLEVRDAGGVLLGTADPIGRLSIGAGPTGLDAAAMRQPRLAADFGALRLLDAAVGSPVATNGGTIELALYWQATRAPGAVYNLALALRHAGGLSPLDPMGPISVPFPTDRWRDGELIVDRRRVVMPLEIGSGPVELLVGAGPPGAALAPTTPASVFEVLARQREIRPPTTTGVAVGARLGEVGQLLGYEAPPTVRRGETMRLVLHWRAAGPAPVAFTVFTHLLDPAEKVRAQRDSQPAAGAKPTTSWIEGEYVRDEYAIEVDPTVPAGEYRIEVGMYDAATGARVGIADAGGSPLGDRLLLGTVLVVDR